MGPVCEDVKDMLEEIPFSENLVPVNNCTDPVNEQNVVGVWKSWVGAALTSEDNGEGGRCLRIALGASPHGTAYAAAELGVHKNAGHTYRISFRVRAGTASQYRAYIYGGAQYQDYPDGEIKEATSEWVEHVLYATLPSGITETRFQLRVHGEAFSGQYIEYDDVSVIQVIGEWKTSSGWAIHMSESPDGVEVPDTVIAVLDGVGEAPDPDPEKWIERPAVQVVVRGSRMEYNGAYRKAKAIMRRLHGKAGDNYNGSRYIQIMARSDILPLGYDGKRRPLFSQNFSVMRTEGTT